MILFAELVFYGVISVSLFIAFFFLLTLIEMKREVKKEAKPSRYPKVTFLIPAWNVEKVIGRCIDSVLKQDYGPNYMIPLD